MVKTSPSNAWSVGLIFSWRAKIPHASWPKNQNMNNKSIIATNSKNTLKNSPHFYFFNTVKHLFLFAELSMILKPVQKNIKYVG